MKTGLSGKISHTTVMARKNGEVTLTVLPQTIMVIMAVIARRNVTQNIDASCLFPSYLDQESRTDSN